MDYYQGEKSPVRTWIPLGHYLPTNSRTFWIGHFFCLLTKRNTELLFLRDETIGWSKEMQKRKQKERVYAACKDSANALSSLTLCKPIIQNLGRSQPLRWVYTTDRNLSRSPLLRQTKPLQKKRKAAIKSANSRQHTLRSQCFGHYKQCMDLTATTIRSLLTAVWRGAPNGHLLIENKACRRMRNGKLPKPRWLIKSLQRHK